jgi:hypothetical protein
MVTVVSTRSTSRWASPPQHVLILCADEGITEELIRDLAGRRYQPLVGRPDWSWRAALEWARPVAAVVDRRHPAARSDVFLATSSDFQVGLVVFGGPADAAPALEARDSRSVRALVATRNVELIGGAVDAAVRRRST